MSLFVGLMLFSSVLCFVCGLVALYFMYRFHTKHDDDNMVGAASVAAIVFFALCGISFSQVIHNIEGSPFKEEKKR